MARIVTFMAIFFLMINLASGMVMDSGYGQAAGIQQEVTGDERVSNASDKAGDIDTGSSGGDDLFGLYQTVTTSVSVILDVVTAGPAMLNQLGVPSLITAPLQTLIIIVYGLGIASLVRGFNII